MVRQSHGIPRCQPYQHTVFGLENVWNSALPTLSVCGVWVGNATCSRIRISHSNLALLTPILSARGVCVGNANHVFRFLLGRWRPFYSRLIPGPSPLPDRMRPNNREGGGRRTPIPVFSLFAPTHASHSHCPRSGMRRSR